MVIRPSVRPSERPIAIDKDMDMDMLIGNSIHVEGKSV